MVRLLKGSGTRPTLVVSSATQDMATPPGGGHRSSATYTHGGPRPPPSTRHGYQSAKKHSKDFKEKMEEVLLEDEKRHVVEQLTRFSQTRFEKRTHRVVEWRCTTLLSSISL